MAIKTITTLKTDVNSNITTNGARDITAAIHNALLQDILDSCVNRISDVSILGLYDFSSSQTYLEGQAVIYDDGSGNKIYRANTDNGPAAFNASEWDDISGDTNLGTSDLTLTANRILSGGGFSLDLGTSGSKLSTLNAETEDGGFTFRENYSVDARYNEIGNDIFTGSYIKSVSAIATTNSEFRTGTSLAFWTSTTSTQKSSGNFTPTEAQISYFKVGTGIVDLRLNGTGGLIARDVVSGLGLNYNDRTVDEASVVWGTDDNHIPSIGLIKANVGASITNDYIPIGNATNDGIEDGKLSQVDGGTATETEILLNDIAYVTDAIHSLDIKGADTGKTDLNRFYQKYIEDTTANPAHHDGVTGKQTWLNELYAQDTSLSIWSNNVDSSQRSSGMEFVAEGLSWVKCRLLTTAAISATNVPILSTGSDIDVVLGTYNTQFCTFRTRNNENRLYIGGINSAFNATMPTGNAYLNLVHSSNVSAEQRPHLAIIDGYDETSGVIDGNVWLSSNDSKFYLRNSNSVNIPLEGLKSVISNSQASTATLTVDSDTQDLETVTALAAAMTIAAPTGTPVDGQKLVIKIKDDGTSRALTWNAIFQVIGTTLPTATTISKWHRIECEYNTTDTKWDVVDVKEQA